VLIAVRNADDSSIRWGTGEFTAAAPGASISDRKRGIITGSGSPEGALSAPVGTEYTDQAATNGAVKWLKFTGSGNTGWRVTYGDTGFRDLSSLLINGWTATAVVAKRVNDNVEMRITNLNGVAATADNILLLPLGWRPTNPTPPNGQAYYLPTVDAGGTADNDHGFDVHGGGTGFLRIRYASPGTRANTNLWTNLYFPAGDIPWPTSLLPSV
jgi:hypothetical protein